MPRPLQTVACVHQPDTPSKTSGSSAFLACFQGAAVVVFFQQTHHPHPNTHLEEKTCLDGQLCLSTIRSNEQCKPGTTKAPWIYWQPQRTLFVLCSFSRAPFSTLFARYRSAKVDRIPSCWFVSSYRFFFLLLGLDWFSAEDRYWRDATLAPVSSLPSPFYFACIRQVHDILEPLCKKRYKSYTTPADCKHDKVGQLGANTVKQTHLRCTTGVNDFRRWRIKIA